MSSTNYLTEAEEERIYLLVEEASEIIQVAQKVLRFGWNSSHPKTGNVPNRDLLEQEIGDFQAALAMMVANGDVDKDNIEHAQDMKNIRMRQFLKHQTIYG